MTIPETYRVWVVDTKPENFELVKRSIPDTSWVELRHLATGEEFIGEMQLNVMNEMVLPHVVLLDFFLGSMFGPDVMEKFNAVFETVSPHLKPYVIAFSSMENSNDAMCQLGAPWAILKIKDAEKNDEIADLFANREKLAGHLGHL